MSVAWNLDVAMQMSSVLVAGRGCTCCAPRLAVGLRRALSRRCRRAVGVSSQQSSYLPTRVTDRSYRPQHNFFCFTHRRISHPFTNTLSAPPLLLPSARLECTVSPASAVCCAENLRGGAWLASAVPFRRELQLQLQFHRHAVGTVAYCCLSPYSSLVRCLILI